VWRRELAGAGIETHFFHQTAPHLTECDVLIVDNKFFGTRWVTDGNGVEAELEKLASRVKKLFWFDITDSSGWDQARALPYVTAYFKNQLLRDRSHYQRPIYGGGRLFADFVFARNLAEDKSPLWSEPISDAKILGKLRVGWNSALADYTLHGPSRMILRQYLPLSCLLRFSRHWFDPARSRPLEISCRFGMSYQRESVAWQRKEISRLVKGNLPTKKLGRRAYLSELASARVVVSPFGLGEITLKDFEVFITGGMLFKPDMTHMETWPDLFRPDETMFTYSWDLSDFEEKLDAILSDEDRRLTIARRGQDLYRRHTVGQEASELFIRYFQTILATNG
jgi:hypothetical protein